MWHLMTLKCSLTLCECVRCAWLLLFFIIKFEWCLHKPYLCWVKTGQNREEARDHPQLVGRSPQVRPGRKRTWIGLELAGPLTIKGFFDQSFCQLLCTKTSYSDALYFALKKRAGRIIRSWHDDATQLQYASHISGDRKSTDVCLPVNIHTSDLWYKAEIQLILWLVWHNISITIDILKSSYYIHNI